PNNQPQDAAIAANPGFYAIRYQGAWHLEQLKSAMAALSGEFAAAESRPAQMVLRRFADFITQSVDQHDGVAELFFPFYRKQSLERRIVFLYWLKAFWQGRHSVLTDSLAMFTYQVVEHCWERLKDEDRPGKRDEDRPGLFCKLISPILDLLDLLSDRQPQASILRRSIDSSLWAFDSTDNVCPDQLCGALSTIRLNQALKLWHKTVAYQHAPVLRLFVWCNALVAETKAANVDAFRSQLSALFESGLLLGGRREIWQQFMELLAKDERDYARIGADFTLLVLAKPCSMPFPEQTFNEINDLFTDNPAWLRWLEKIQINLEALQSLNSQALPNAWRQRSVWRKLREEIVLRGAELFTVSNGHALIALWLPHMAQVWTDFIDQQLQDLDALVRQYPKSYLGIESVDRWINDGSVQLELSLNNRFPVAVHLDSLGWQGAQHRYTDPELPMLLPTDNNPRTLNFKLSCAGDQLQGVLKIHLSEDESGRTHVIDYPLDKKRELPELSDDPAWARTWQRLKTMLREAGTANAGFYWVDGTIWSPGERDAIKQAVEY
ncbi:MAG: hypothetical protein ABL925_21025, partial [Methylococcales bacterium]